VGGGPLSLTLPQAARLYGAPVIDYERESRGLLVSSGAGIMMAVMDEVPTLRWCVDIDRMPSHERLPDFLLMAERVCEPLAVCGWFSLTDPTPLRRAIEGLADPSRCFCYGGNIRFGAGTECGTMRELLGRLGGAA